MRRMLFWRPSPRWPWWLSTLSMQLLCMPAFASLYVALRFDRPPSIFAMVAPYLTTTFFAWHMERDYWALSPTDREAVQRITWSAVPVDAPCLNAIAVRRLERAVREYRSNVIASAVLPPVWGISSVVAAVRASPWWLLALISLPTVFGAFSPRVTRATLEERLSDLRAALDHTG